MRLKAEPWGREELWVLPADLFHAVPADMDAEREALQSAAYPEVQTFCQKHGLMFEVSTCPL